MNNEDVFNKFFHYQISSRTLKYRNRTAQISADITILLFNNTTGNINNTNNTFLTNEFLPPIQNITNMIVVEI